MKFLVALVPLLIVISGCAGYRFLAVFPLTAKSHFMMYEALLKSLARKGHQVDVASTFPLKKPVPNYNDFMKLPPQRVFVNNLTYDEANLLVGFKGVENLVHIGGTQLCPLLSYPKLFHLIKNPPKDPPYDALILEIFSAPCYYIIGHLMNITIIAASSSTLYPWGNDNIANPENLAYITNNMLALPHNMAFWQRVQNVVISTGIKELYKIYTINQDEVIRDIFGEGMPSVRELERRVSIIVANSHMSLVGIRPTMPSYVEVGGLHIQDGDIELSPSLEKWLNESTDGFLYFSFGSMVLIETFPRELLEIFYKSLAKLAPIRVLMKVPKPWLLPPGLPKNIRTEPWMPQVRVLKHPNIKAFITHGGLMGTQEAIYCGVPLVAIPLFADQFVNSEIYAARKIAVKLDMPGLTVEKMDAALDAVLNDPIYRNTVRKLSIKFRDRPMSPGDTAVYWIEYVMKHGPDALRSAAMDLTWWQVALLDVYLFLFLAAVVTIIVIAFLLRFVIKLIITGSASTSRAKKVN